MRDFLYRIGLLSSPISKAKLMELLEVRIEELSNAYHVTEAENNRLKSELELLRTPLDAVKKTRRRRAKSTKTTKNEMD